MTNETSGTDEMTRVAADGVASRKPGPWERVITGYCLVCGVCLGAVLLVTKSALAGPWPQNEGGGILIGSVSYLETDNRLSNTNPAIGDGTYSRLGFGLYGEYGVTDTWTIGGSSRIERVRLHGPVVSGETTGVPDVELFVRKVLWQEGPGILAAQGTIAIPTGYNINRNPALGDGAVALEPRVLYGQGIDLGAWPSFFSVEAAYRFRFGDPSDQVRIDATLGTHPADGWMLLLQSRNTISVQNQNGSSVPGPAFTGWHGTDYDLYNLTLSVVRDVSPTWSVEIGGYSEIGARNYNAGSGGFVSVWRRF